MISKTYEYYTIYIHIFKRKAFEHLIDYEIIRHKQIKNKIKILCFYSFSIKN